jgi:hypothetical protein
VTRLVFLVHGVGRNPPGWSAEARAVLARAAARYAGFAGGPPLEERVRFVEVTYDEVFDRYVDRVGAELGALAAFVREQGGPRLAKLGGWLAQATPTERALFWTHAADAVLYRYAPQLRDPVRVSVMTQIVDAVTAARAGGELAEVSVLAHSLGCAVATDALHLLATRPFGGSDAFLAGRDLTVRNLFAVANVARAVQGDVDPYASPVRPASAGPAPTYVTRYHAFAHALDPFTRVRPFAPPGWGADYFPPDPPLRHLRGFDVHALEHYLDHPAVHAPVLNGVFGAPVVTAKERVDALAAYPAVAGPCPSQLVGLWNALAQLAAPRDFEEMLVRGVQALDAGRAARAACPG